MTTFKDHNFTELSGPKDTLQEFVAGTATPMLGLEVEQQLFKDGAPMDVQTFEALSEKTGGAICPEASAQTFEVNSARPYAKGEEQACVNEILGQYNKAVKSASGLGLTVSPFSVFPTENYKELCHNIHPRPRSQAFLSYFTEKRPELARYFTTVSGIQSSHSPKTPHDGLKYYSRMAHLSPIIATFLSTAPPFATGDNDNNLIVVRNNLSHARRLDACGIDGAFAPALWENDGWTEENGEKFMAGYNDLIWNTELFCHIDPDTRHETLFDNKATYKLCELPAHIQTRANFNLASSIQYQLISISAIPPSTPEGAYGRRIETRFIDNGDEYQVNSLAGLSFALAFDEQFQESVDCFLRSSGFDPEHPGTTKATILRDVQRAAQNFENLANLSFANHNMAEAARDLSQVLSQYCDRYPLLRDLTVNLDKGETPALQFRKAFPDKETFRDYINKKQIVKIGF